MGAVTSNILINDENEVKINRMLFSIIILNFIDGILTYVGVSKGYIFEMNRMMTSIVSDFNKLMVYKLLLPTCAILMVNYLFRKQGYTKMPVGHFMIKVCFWVYCFILLLHLNWLAVTAYRLLT